MSLIIGHRRSPTESEKRDNSVIGTHSLPVGLPRSERSVKTTFGLHGRYWHSADEPGCPNSRRVLEGKRTIRKTPSQEEASRCGSAVVLPSSRRGRNYLLVN